MTNGDGATPDGRVLLLAPTSRDAATTVNLLSSAGIAAEACETFGALVQGLEAHPAAMLFPEEALSLPRMGALREFLARQPPWSDIPILVMTRPGADSAELSEAVRVLGNVTLLERPLRVATLLSAVRTALRARARQYQIRGHLVERARAEESLRIADQRKDEFLATLGHELRNPLAPLVTGLKVLALGKPQDPVALRVLAIMERQTGHLTRLVDDLLEVSRITRGRIEVQREPVDLAFVIRSAVETSRPAIESAEHELTVDLPVEPITILGDAVRLTQVFANLLNNAAKYTNNGGHIALSVARRGERVMVSVRDDGIGLPPSELTHVFDMFTQVNRADRRAQGGLGIGLTLVRSLVDLHEGSVEARSPGLGAGSEFVVELPTLSVHRPQAESADAVVTLPPRRVLVVDDNRDAGDALGVLLAALGATVSVAHSGQDALATLDDFGPDAALLDIGMPELDGLEVARRIRASSHGNILLIALSGWGQEHDHRKSRAAGFDHHLVKPPDIHRLRDILATGWRPSQQGLVTEKRQ